jgi:hypothetical protein
MLKNRYVNSVRIEYLFSSWILAGNIAIWKRKKNRKGDNTPFLVPPQGEKNTVRIFGIQILLTYLQRSIKPIK